MREIPGLEQLLEASADRGVFGTKERSVIHQANPAGIAAIVTQQIEIAKRVLDRGLVPIIEPEVDISAPDKPGAEELLKQELLRQLDNLGGEHKVALKLTIPSIDGFYAELVEHPRVARVVALSGGYPREEASAKLSRNPGIIASFSRALLDGLNAQQSDQDFDQTLDASIETIYRASIS